jgi:urease accessory protein
MNARVSLLAVPGLALVAGPAMAHPPPLGITGFAGGLLHPLFVPAHLLAVLALGLLIGQQVTWGRMPAFAFVIGVSGGLGILTLGVVPSLMNELVLSCALVAGLLAAIARTVPEAAGCSLAVLAGFCIGLDSPPEALSLAEANLMLVGTGLSAAVSLFMAMEIARWLTSDWTRVAARILGSWIAASAILVLALRVVR